MTDNEIIKALKCCSTYKGKCTDCPAFAKVDRSNCKQVLLGAIEIINRQKAEIERLEDLVYSADTEAANVRALYFEEKSERAEVIKEFAERLKEKSEYFWEEKDSFVSEDDIDNLVKEMVGEDAVDESTAAKAWERANVGEEK